MARLDIKFGNVENEIPQEEKTPYDLVNELMRQFTASNEAITKRDIRKNQIDSAIKHLQHIILANCDSQYAAKFIDKFEWYFGKGSLYPIDEHILED